MKTLTKLFHDDAGATAIEYGLIADVIVTAVTSIGTKLSSTFNSVATSL
jgi:pilus assembly protein Flp/PilA